MWDDSANIYSTSEHKLCLRLGHGNTQKLKQKGPSIRKPKRAPQSTYHKNGITSQKKREQKKTKRNKTQKHCITKIAIIQSLPFRVWCERECNSRSLITLLALRRPSAWCRPRRRRRCICDWCCCRCARNARRTSSCGLRTGVRRDDGAFTTFARRLRFFFLIFDAVSGHVVLGIFELCSSASALESCGLIWLFGDGRG